MKIRHLAGRFLPLILALLLAAGCGQGSAGEETGASADTEVLETENPFAASEELGNLVHGASNVSLDESGEALPFEYDGGVMQIEYSVSASGMGKNVGFLLFLDGIPQPWQLNGEGETAYIQYLELENDDEVYPFTLAFVPVTGSSGDTLTLTVCSITNAQFQPDMVSTASYGLYHDALQYYASIQFNADPEQNETGASASPVLSDVSLEDVKITTEFVENDLMEQYGSEGKTEDELLESGVYTFVRYDGSQIYDNLDVSGKDKVHITYQICGVPGRTYRVALYGNHQLLSDETQSYWEVTLKTGEVATLEADVNVDVLEDMTTIYIIACPVSGTAGILKKTNSILFYDLET